MNEHATIAAGTATLARPPLDTRRPPIVQIENGAFDEEDGVIILQGRVAPDTLRFLKIDLEADGGYQRDHPVDMAAKRRLKAFPVTDPTWQQLAGSGGTAPQLLYHYMLKKYNQGLRNRLVAWK